MKRILLLPLAALACLCAVPDRVHAEITAADNVPASTLLIPYFEVDLSDPAGSNTVVSWRSTSPTAALTHVTVYSDFGQPVLTFNVYLTGLDMVTLDLRSMLVHGHLPITATDGQDWQDDISPQGSHSQDINFASCNGEFPYGSPVLFPETVADLQRQLTGQRSTHTNRCHGFDHGDNIARGYITIDMLQACVQADHTLPGYFDLSATSNHIAGEYLLFGEGGRMAHAAPAVAIEASPDLPEVSTAGNYTFYGRFVGWTAADRREPLPTTWAANTQARGAELLVWRDIKVAQSAANTTTSCAVAGPSWYPLGGEAVLNFDHQAQPLDATADLPFPLATQRVRLDAAALQAHAKNGWSYLGLSSFIVPAGDNPPVDPAAAQAHVTVIQFPETSGHGGGGVQATALDTAADASHIHPESP